MPQYVFSWIRYGISLRTKLNSSYQISKHCASFSGTRVLFACLSVVRFTGLNHFFPCCDTLASLDPDYQTTHHCGFLSTFLNMLVFDTHIICRNNMEKNILKKFFKKMICGIHISASFKFKLACVLYFDFLNLICRSLTHYDCVTFFSMVRSIKWV